LQLDGLRKFKSIFETAVVALITDKFIMISLVVKNSGNVDYLGIHNSHEHDDDVINLLIG
jgi:hypothetical protein